MSEPPVPLERPPLERPPLERWVAALNARPLRWLWVLAAALALAATAAAMVPHSHPYRSSYSFEVLYCEHRHYRNPLIDHGHLSDVDSHYISCR